MIRLFRHDSARLDREIEQLKDDVQFWSSRCIERTQEVAELRRLLAEANRRLAPFERNWVRRSR